MLLTQFKAICQIPHPSGHLDALRAYIINNVSACGLTAEVDRVGNIKVDVPASEGWAAKAEAQGRNAGEVTVLQAHYDMVPQANQELHHDFEHDPLKLRRVGDLLMATGTTLGADNGIGVAAMLAIANDDTLVHGPLELLFTVDEEVGMAGVRQMRGDWLKGTTLLNLDTEKEGELMVGCAGAVDITASYRYKLEEGMPDGDVPVLLSLKGLKGGHSGMDIHLGRGNACKLMARFLKHAVVNFEARLAWMNGGGVRNAIPREAEALITVPAEVVDELMDEVAYYAELFRYELRGADDGVVFTAIETSAPDTLLPEEVQDDILNSLEAVHDGVLRFSPDVPGVVETSSNLATVEMTRQGDAGICNVVIMARGLNEEMKRAIASRIQSTFILSGARVDFSAAYPGWELPLNSPLLRRMRQLYASLFGTEARINSVHCGLECGIIHDLYPQMQIISFGPTIHHPHSPEESVELNSIDRFWRLLCEAI
ncbi:MAG: beta-Ala-His dipeptidase [Bacteroidales bacterium]|nr:beta-Ala-His dipeptidase [Candidatus Liminaster caballi]